MMDGNNVKASQRTLLRPTTFLITMLLLQNSTNCFIIYQLGNISLEKNHTIGQLISPIELVKIILITTYFH